MVPMNILIVNKFLYPNGGSETYIFKLGEELVRMGHKVEYFGMEHEGRIVGNRVNQYTSDMDFHTSALKKVSYPFKIIYSTEAYKKLWKVMDDFKPQVVHLNNFNFQLTPSVIYAVKAWEKKNKTKVKLVYTAHDYQWVCPNHMLKKVTDGELCFACENGKFFECTKNKCIHGSTVKSLLGTLEAKLYYLRKTYSLVDLIISPSAFLGEKLKTYPGIANKIVVMHNFLDTTKIKEEKKDYVLYFGRYSKEKGVETLLKAAAALPKVSFVFAGGGPLKEEVSKLPNVKDMGFLSGEELINTISAAKFSVFPSEWYENCPFSLMESQVYGTPVIASNLGGAPELLKDGVTGELFTPGDDKELAKRIEALCEDKERLEKYTSNCAEVHFDNLSEYTEKYLELVK